MKMKSTIVCFGLGVALLSCEQKSSPEMNKESAMSAVIEHVREDAAASFKSTEIPILPITKGDSWVYEVKLQIAENKDDEPVLVDKEKFERKRVYLGKMKPPGDFPETDCFEIEAAGIAVEREYVDIKEDRILMRGAEIVGTKAVPYWLNPGVIMVKAGVLAGESLPPIRIKDPNSDFEVSREIQIIGRETISLAGRDFATIRILMTGDDGRNVGLQMRRTIWFAPKYGIVKEEKNRYVNDRLMLKELVELKSFEIKSAVSP